MKLIVLLISFSILLAPCYAQAADYNIEYNNLELEFGLSYNYHPYLDNITEDITGENTYLNQNKFNFLNINADTNAFTKLEYSLGYQAQIKYWLLDVLAVGGELERINLESSYRAEKDDKHDSYYLQTYNLSSSALLAIINLRPFGQQLEELKEESFWQRLIFDLNFGGGLYYNKFIRSYDIDMYYENSHYLYTKEDEYDGVVPGFKGGVELSYLINQRSSVTLGAKYNKILAKRLTDETGKGYRSIYSDDFQAEEFDFSNYGLYFNLVFKL